MRPRPSSPQSRSYGRSQYGGGGGGGGGGFRRGAPRVFVCRLCASRTEPDYKNVAQLKSFIGDRGKKILSRRATKLCAKHQARLARAIKRARMLALIPFTAVHEE